MNHKYLKKLFQQGDYYCIYCEKIKDISEFTKSTSYRLGVRTACKECMSKKNKKNESELKEITKIIRRRKALLKDGKNICSKCEEIKSLDNFNKNGTRGYVNICRICKSKNKNYSETYKKVLENEELEKENKFRCTKCDTIKMISEVKKGTNKYRICKPCINKANRKIRSKKKELTIKQKQINYMALIIYLAQKPFFNEMKKNKNKIVKKYYYNYDTQQAQRQRELYKANPGYQRLKRSIIHLFDGYIKTEKSYILAGSQRLIKLVERKAISYEEAQTIGKELIINPYEVAPKIFQITKIN